MQRKTFAVLFFIKKTRKNKYGECPIMLRITVNGISQETLISRSINPDVWDQRSERAIGKDRISFETNSYLDALKAKVIQIHRQMELDGVHITARDLKDRIRGNGAKPKMLLEEFRQHNDQCRKLIGTEYSPATVSRFDRVVRYLGEYMQTFYKSDDIPLKEIGHEYITNFEYYLKTEKQCGHNAVVKQLKCLKKIVRIAIQNDWINKDPFRDIKLREKTTEREFLVKEEIERIMTYEFSVKRIEQVRDIFIFCCFTDFAQTDKILHFR